MPPAPTELRRATLRLHMEMDAGADGGADGGAALQAGALAGAGERDEQKHDAGSGSGTSMAEAQSSAGGVTKLGRKRVTVGSTPTTKHTARPPNADIAQGGGTGKGTRRNGDV